MNPRFLQGNDISVYTVKQNVDGIPCSLIQQVDMNDVIHRQQVHMRIRRHARMDVHGGRMDVRHVPMFPNQFVNRDREPVKREVRHARVNIEGDIIRYEKYCTKLPYTMRVRLC